MADASSSSDSEMLDAAGGTEVDDVAQRVLELQRMQLAGEVAPPCGIDGCSYTPRTRTYSNLFKHQQSMHGAVPNIPCVTSDCDERFFSPGSRTMHITLRHATGGELVQNNMAAMTRLKPLGDAYSCWVCTSTFGGRLGVQQHLVDIHGASKVFVCHVSGGQQGACEAFFTAKGELDQHHADVHRDAVQRALRRVQAEPQVGGSYDCPFCDHPPMCDRRATRAHLARKHRAEANIPCLLCDTAMFFSRDLRTVHERSEHAAGDNRLPCFVRGCPLTFRYPSNRVAHLEREHRGEISVCPQPKCWLELLPADMPAHQQFCRPPVVLGMAPDSDDE